MMKLRTRRALAVAGTAVAASLVLSGCSTLNSLLTGDAVRDEDTGQATEESDIDIFALKVGDCMPLNESTGEMQEATIVPCDEPHADEVYYEFELPDGDFPSDEDIQAAGEAECVPAFADYVGLDYQSSVLDIWWITPTAAGWEQADDRLVQCVVYDPANDAFTGSVKGAAR